MIRVCDAIMGSGKTESAITYINEHPDKKYIYISPYCKEGTRIAKSCRALKFKEPDDAPEHGSSKVRHTRMLLESGKNIATTHQALRLYTYDILDMIREKHYTLIVDESLETLSNAEVIDDDIRVAEKSGLIEADKNGVYRQTAEAENYHGELFQEVLRLVNSSELVKTHQDEEDDIESGTTRFYFWSLDQALLEAFDDVFILTYMFESQNMHHMLEMKQIPYKYIGVARDEDGTFRFADTMQYVPEYTKHLSDMIDILDNDKLNSVGKDHYALSMSWFESKKLSRRREVKQLQKHIYNYFCNYNRPYKAEARMWATYSGAEGKIAGDGYKKSFVSFNYRATNEYSDRVVLAYCVNVFMNVAQKLYYQSYGIEVDEDAYALSVMIQWIWRSAIRNGQQIHIYVPSARMRGLLRQWIASVESLGEGGEAA